MELAPVFDKDKFTCSFRIPGKTPVVLRWPTDEEWVQWASERIIRVRDSRTDFPNGDECARRLVEKIVVDGDATQFDGAECAQILNGFQDSFRIAGVDTNHDGQRVAFELQVPGGYCSVIMRIPTLKESQDVRGRMTRRQSIGRAEHVHIELQPQAEYFDRFFESQVGYGPSGGGDRVPILHKAAVMRAMNEELDAAFTVTLGGPTTAAPSSTNRSASGV